jgi:serine/threonine-protein kinase
MNPRPDLLELGTAIADGAPVDWDAASQRLGPASHAIVRRLQLVDRIARAHASLPASSVSASAVHTGVPSPSNRAPESADAPIRWGPLTILERIGRGTFGDVYRAHDSRLDRPVALKLVRRRERNAPTLESAVIEEGRLLARVHHPNIVTIYGAERIDGRVGLWMEYIDGHTLEDELRERGPLQAREVAAIGIDLCRALHAMHEAGLVHRDVKAQNVMRDRTGRVIVTDFGAGHELVLAGDVSRELAGTPLYLAPDVLNGQPASAVSDLYSAGVLLYHLATGSFPVRAATIPALRDAHAQGVVPTQQARSDVPPALAAIIDRAIASDPSARYATAADLERALTALVTPPLSRWRPLGIAAAIVMTLGAVTAIGTWSSRGSTAAARLNFQPRDLVLVARFENRTANPIFDGALEYALERELTSSDVVGLVPHERVEDTLGLMKRPPDIVVDHAIGREVCVRDGHIKALLTGRVEQFGTTYVLTAQLVDPADDAVVATIEEEANGDHAILPALRREGARVRLALGEHRDRIKGSGDVEPATTQSLKAFQLYNESYQLGRARKWPAALAVARQVVAEDRDFGSAWIWLAWCTRNAELGDTTTGLESQEVLRVRETYRPFLERAVALADSAVPWERHWILGSSHTLLGDDRAAVPAYEALLKLLPDHFFAANNLAGALERLNRPAEALQAWKFIADQRPNLLDANYRYAWDLVRRERNVQEARPYVDRVRRLLPADGKPDDYRHLWLKWLPTYERWDAGDVAGVLEALQTEEAAVGRHGGAISQPEAYAIGLFYQALGRVRDARRWLTGTSIRGDGRALNSAWLAVAQGDRDAAREAVARIVGAPGRPAMTISVNDRSRAQKFIDHPPSDTPVDRAFVAIGRGGLLVADGRPDEAIPYLQRAMTALQPTRFHDYYIACEWLADAYGQTKRPADSIAALETCAQERPRYDGVFFSSPLFWMHLQLTLADSYRATGRLPEAQRIERDLRRRLAVADADYLLMRLLNNR